METHESKDGKQAYVHCKEYTSSLFDRTGRMSIENLSHHDLIVRYKGSKYTKGFPRRYYPAKSHSNVVVKAQEIEVNPAFYSDWGSYSELLSTIEIPRIGKGSFVMSNTTEWAKTKHALYKCSTLMVEFDLQTRKSTPFLENAVEKSKPFLSGQAPKFMNPLNYKPSSNAYHYSFVVPPSDLDILLHVNNTNYLKYCMDCATFAARDRAYSIFIEDIQHYHVHTISMLYINESRLGDRLEVISWEDTDKPYILYFVIMKGVQEIFHSIVEFNVTTSRL
ncbi:uncharacterized protein LOC144447089 [Glandiceps talaboti]